MINKISNSSRAQLADRDKKETRPQKKKAAASTNKDSLSYSILQAISQKNIEDPQSLKSKLITETLTQVLGDKASKEIAFKQLFNKISDALENDASNQQIQELLEAINQSR